MFEFFKKKKPIEKVEIKIANLTINDKTIQAFYE